MWGDLFGKWVDGYNVGGVVSIEDEINSDEEDDDDTGSGGDNNDFTNTRDSYLDDNGSEYDSSDDECESDED